MAQAIAHQQWSNFDNRAFYERLSINSFKDYARSSGIENTIDVENISNTLTNSNSLLEVNAGYGRVIEGLININYKGQITAIERNEKFVCHMQTHFNSKIKIIHGDVMKQKFSHSFDTILLMWSCISEFNYQEQTLLLQKLSQLLSKKGYLIIDMIADDEQLPHVNHDNNRHLKVFFNGQTESFFIPTRSELFRNIKASGLTVRKIIPYTARNNINRVIYISGLTSQGERV